MADIKIVPIHPEAGWAQIHLKELYKGPTEVGPNPPGMDNSRKIPRVGWWVVSENEFSFVSRVNADFTSVLTRFRPGGAADEENIITGPTVHQWISPFVMEVDPSRTPIRFRVRSECEIHGSEPVYFKIFAGRDTSVNGRVISTAVNGAGIPTDANLMLELVKGPNGNYVAVKVAKGGHLLEIPANQDVCTLVAYSANGMVTDYRPLVVAYTDNIAPLEQAKRRVFSIALDNPYISKDDPDLLEYPLNMLVESAGTMGVVNYSDGSFARLPISGSKFTLSGHQDFVASVPGPMFKLGLAYTLSDDEEAWNALGNIPKRSMTRDYKVRAIEADGNYSVKLFVIPYWDRAGGMYKLRYYLYNMKRDLIREVTEHIEVTPGFVFDGKVYNRRQDMSVAINLTKLGPAFFDYRHVQRYSITLINPGSTAGQPTYFQQTYSDEYTYGLAIRADVTTNPSVPTESNLNIGFNASTVDEWLERTYRAVEPLYYTQGENVPPNPTDVTLRDLGDTWRRVVSVDDVLKPISGLSGTFNQGDALILEFSANTPEGKIELAICNMVINRLQ